MKDQKEFDKKIDKILLHKPMQQKDLKKTKTKKPESKNRSIQKKS